MNSPFYGNAIEIVSKKLKTGTEKPKIIALCAYLRIKTCPKREERKSREVFARIYT